MRPSCGPARSPGARSPPAPSRVGQHVAIGMATERSATTRLNGLTGRPAQRAQADPLHELCPSQPPPTDSVARWPYTCFWLHIGWPYGKTLPGDILGGWPGKMHARVAMSRALRVLSAVPCACQRCVCGGVCVGVGGCVCVCGGGVGVGVCGEGGADLARTTPAAHRAPRAPGRSHSPQA